MISAECMCCENVVSSGNFHTLSEALVVMHGYGKSESLVELGDSFINKKHHFVLHELNRFYSGKLCRRNILVDYKLR